MRYRTAQGVCAYIKEQYPDEASWAEQGVVVGYDGRYNSQRFAELTAIVFLSQNFRVYLFRRIVPTPFVPYTVQRLSCLGGVMVTASHNPKQDNGYKVWLANDYIQYFYNNAYRFIGLMAHKSYHRMMKLLVRQFWIICNHIPILGMRLCCAPTTC